MISITLNGKPHQIEGPTGITDFLRALDINPQQVAVALNGEVVPRDRWPSATIREGDAVEVVRAVGGGALTA